MRFYRCGSFKKSTCKSTENCDLKIDLTIETYLAPLFDSDHKELFLLKHYIKCN